MMEDKVLLDIIRSLTLEEKAMLCSGEDFWTTKAFPDKNIPSLRMSDGPHGVRYEDHAHIKENKGPSKPATCFPPEVALASSWNPALTKKIGQAIAEECLHYGIGLLLGPGVNIKRSPLAGRNFEYYSEDPLLSGELASGFINGVQSKGVGTSLKHLAVNNQERYRMSISAAVDQRALHDLYLKPFEIAVKKAKPATVMASYNRVNGTYATQHRQLLNDTLRLRFGFAGAVISDWGAVYNRTRALNSGLDLEMPASGSMNDYAIVQAVKDGLITEDTLDTACWNILRLVFTYSKEALPPPACNFQTHHQLAVEAMVQSAVLLKNEDILPLDTHLPVLIIGDMAANPRYQGGGSSLINPLNLNSFIDAADQAGTPYHYEQGYVGTKMDKALMAQAKSAAAGASSILLFLGLPDVFECEGYDREHLSLPLNQIALLEAIAEVNPNICVVLSCGAPVEAPWLSKVKALLCKHLGGEGGGEGTLRLLYGLDNPSGKLAESWPKSLSQTPAFRHFPKGPEEVSYNESIFVGYRYYDTVEEAPLFPFGFGLSYTSFSYSQLQLSAGNLNPEETLTASCTIKNTGTRTGTEVAQLYIAHLYSAHFQPAHELQGFQRITLNPGEEKQVQFKIPYKNLAFWDTSRSSPIIEEGVYELQIGSSSRTLPLTKQFRVKGVTTVAPTGYSSKGAYGTLLNNNRFSDDNFAVIYGKSLHPNTKPAKGNYTDTTPIGLMDASFLGRRLFKLIEFVASKAIHFSTDPVVIRRSSFEIAHDLPFKNLSINSSGILSPKAAKELLALCNGKGSTFRLLKELFRPQPYRKRPYRKRNRP